MEQEWTYRQDQVLVLVTKKLLRSIANRIRKQFRGTLPFGSVGPDPVYLMVSLVQSLCENKREDMIKTHAP